MNNYKLEIATFTLDGIMKAANAGANRIELCENPNDGGTTPSYGMLKKVKSLISIPVFPIIRPRGGNFVYSEIEFEVMKLDILLCKELGYEGVVLGLLDSNGDVDKARVAELVAIASPMQVTFHRAFDRTANPMLALEDVIKCGCTRILSSGQCASVENGVLLIKQLIEQANNRIIIMPGSGLTSKNVRGIAMYTNANEFHTAARKKQNDENVFTPLSMNEKLSYTSVDVDEVRKIRTILDVI